MASDTTGPAPAITDEMVERAARVLALTPWDDLPEMFQAAIRAQAERVLHAGLAGRTVVELPAPDEREDDQLMWTVNAADDYAAIIEVIVDEVGPVVVCASGELTPQQARDEGLAMLAAADRAERLASESSGDGGSNG